MNTVYLIRHGEAFSNLNHVFSYRKVDLSLTEKGKLQAQQLAIAMKAKPVDELYCSPLKRAIETAGYVSRALGIPYTIRENFREVNIGNLEDMEDLNRAWEINLGVWSRWSKGEVDACCPEGETWTELYTRMVDGLYPLLEGRSGRHIGIVCHGGIITATLGKLVENVDYARLYNRPSHNCSITEVQLEAADGKIYGQLVCWSDVSHLSGEAAELISGVPGDKFESGTSDDY